MQAIWLTMDGIGATKVSGEIHQVSAMDQGRPAQTGDEYLLPVLYNILSDHTDKDTLLIWADERIPVDTVIRALYTGGRAGFREYAFVVGPPGGREIIRVDPPIFAFTQGEFHGPAWADLELSWTPEGVAASLWPRYSERGPQPRAFGTPLDLGAGTCVFPGGPRPDAKALRETLDALCVASEGKPFAIHAVLSQSERLGDVLWTLSNDPRPAECRLTTIVEAGIDQPPHSCKGARPLREAIAAYPADHRVTGWESPGVASGSDADGPFDSGDQSEAGFGGRGKRVPRVRQAKAQVKGPLDKDIVRRIVRAHINEVRSCYNKALERDPEAAGRVAIDFTIGAKGKIAASKVQESTIADEQLGRCITKAVKRWKFPKPQGGGQVQVTYPFVFSPA